MSDSSGAIGAGSDGLFGKLTLCQGALHSGGRRSGFLRLFGSGGFYAMRGLAGRRRIAPARALARAFAATLVLAPALALSGCSSLGGKEPPPTYELFAARDFPRHTGGGRGQLIVQEPTALSALDSDRIMVQLADGGVAQLPNAQWEDRLPKLLQARIVQSFENGHRLRAVGRPGDRLAADYQLVTDIRAFQVSAVDGTAVVEIAAKIVRERTGRIGPAKVFKVSVPADSTAGPAAVAAINAAFTRVATQMVIWASRYI
jgi:cholesterol transport system auxiliary component